MTGPAAHTLLIQAPAKINLFLQVTGRRPDGYHELVTLMCPVSLHDTLRVDFGKRGIRVRCSDPRVPEDESNLVHRTAALFAETLNLSEGVHITIEKRIPVAAGLGGGSSDAAAVLKAMNRFFGLPCSGEQLSALGRRIGADVPFFIFGKPALARGIGEILEPYTRLAPLHALLIFPGFGISTAETFKNLNLTLTNCKKIHIDFLFNGGAFDATRHLCNDLETVTAAQHPEIQAAKSSLLGCGALGALMSGSGPTVFGLFTDREQAQHARDTLSADHPRWELFLTDLIRA